MSDFEKAIAALRDAHGAWVSRATFNASDVGLLRHALRRIADDDAAGARHIARDALAKLAEDEAAREAATFMGTTDMHLEVDDAKAEAAAWKGACEACYGAPVAYYDDMPPCLPGDSTFEPADPEEDSYLKANERWRKWEERARTLETEAIMLRERAGRWKGLAKLLFQLRGTDSDYQRAFGRSVVEMVGRDKAEAELHDARAMFWQLASANERRREAIERELATFDAPHDASSGAAWHLINCIRAVLKGGGK